MANNCCPEGYFLITPGGGRDPFCCNLPNGMSCAGLSIPTIPCPSAGCCSEGFAYIDSTGHFISPTLGYTMITNPDPFTYTGKCVRIVNNTWAILDVDPPTPIDCPCCPTNYSYSSITATCINDIDKSQVSTVPCIVCNCTQPPITFNCPTCGTKGQAIYFSFNFEVKNCTSCTVQNNNIPCGKIVSFVPQGDLDPIISNFKLRNKNFI